MLYWQLNNKEVVFSMLSFLLAARPWAVSEFSELPSVSRLPDQDLRDYGLIAGGLALLLSRCSDRAMKLEFKAAEKAYRSLQRQMKRNERIRLSPYLLSDVSHEVAQYTDVATREALRRCMRHAQ